MTCWLASLLLGCQAIATAPKQGWVMDMQRDWKQVFAPSFAAHKKRP